MYVIKDKSLHDYQKSITFYSFLFAFHPATERRRPKPPSSQPRRQNSDHLHAVNPAVRGIALPLLTVYSAAGFITSLDSYEGPPFQGDHQSKSRANRAPRASHQRGVKSHPAH